MLYIKHKEECFIRYPNTEKWVEKNEAQASPFNQLLVAENVLPNKTSMVEF